MTLEAIARRTFKGCDILESEPDRIQVKHQGFDISHSQHRTEVVSRDSKGIPNTVISVQPNGNTSIESEGESHPKVFADMARLARQAYREFHEKTQQS